MINAGKSKTVKEAVNLIKEIESDIDQFDYDVTIKYRTIDWGTKKRGQGKRIGCSMVIGNPDAPTGIKEYPYVDLSEYDECKDDFRYLTANRAIRYVIARKFGCNHIEARCYAIL